jgi:hypothetical protein
MGQGFGSDFVFNSLFWSLHHVGGLKGEINPEDVPPESPLKLDTTSLKLVKILN